MPGPRFRRVACMADDAITVRLHRTLDGCIGSLDFPPFQIASGKIIKASTLPPLPAEEALLKASRIQPFTPFDEVVVTLEEGVAWLPGWGELI